MPELRKDPITGRWVIIAIERAMRPSDFKTKEIVEKEPKAGPFSEGNESQTPPEILSYRTPGTAPNTPGWWVRVIPNKFPALKIEGDLNRKGIGVYDMMNGIGAHEVIIESPNPADSLENLPVKHIEDILWAFRDRFLDLRKDTCLKYIIVFKNKGKEAGASLSHTHSQLIATPVVPKTVKEELEGSRRYYDYKERCVYCDMVAQEIGDKQRLVLENQGFVAFVPFASIVPFETWILPKQHSSDYAEIKRSEISYLADALQRTLKMLSKVVPNVPYNFYIHSAPLNNLRLPHYHWHIEIVPRLTQTAGFEWGTGLYINPMSPENAAKFLRETEGK